jgi:uncharacterized coiled-coil DUF342 family protein
LNERNEYIGKLPTIDEVAENQRKFEELGAENEELKVKMKELERKVVRAKEFIKEKNAEVKCMQEKVEGLQMERERAETEFELYKKATQNVGELMSRCEESASLRAEFELAKKMILRCEEKNRSVQARCEARVEELREERRLEADVSQGLRHELEVKEKSLKKLSQSVRVSLVTRNLRAEMGNWQVFFTIRVF